MNNIATVVMLDLSAMFDTVDHKLLLDKLKMEFKRWTRSPVATILLLRGYPWITLHTHLELSRNLELSMGYRSYNNKSSKKYNLTHGVPQESILAPTLFTIQIQNLR